MSRHRFIGYVKQYLFPAMGVVLGLAASTAFMLWFSQLQVHQVLTEHVPNRAYVSVDCVHSKNALAAIAQYPGDNEIALVPLDAIDSPERDILCENVIRIVRDRGSVLLRFIPEGNLCRRLTREARAWLEAPDSEHQVEVPSWVLDGQLLASGWSDEIIAALQREGILSEAFEPL